jgi:hypothetical protein
MPHVNTSRFAYAAYTLLVAALLCGSPVPVVFAADLTASSNFPTVFFDDIDTGTNPDWRITADTVNFRIFDGQTSRTPFRITVGAPEGAVFVSGSGNFGLGTLEPMSQLHLANGDTPTVRLEQNNSIGNTPYTWEVGGNEFNFFVNDVTGGGDRPFLIIPGAPESSLHVAGNGNIGLQTPNPQGNLHIFGAANQDVFNGIGPDLGANGTALNFGYSGSSFGVGSGFFNVRPAPGSVAPNPSLRFATANVQRMIITNTGRIGIGTLAPSQLLDVAGNVRADSFIAGSMTLNVPDYVFAKNYKLRPLSELAAYITKEQHLPEIPSAKEIQQQGININEFQMQLLKKVEELTLYTLQQAQVNQVQARQIKTLRAQLTQLKRGQAFGKRRH